MVHLCPESSFRKCPDLHQSANLPSLSLRSSHSANEHEGGGLFVLSGLDHLGGVDLRGAASQSGGGPSLDGALVNSRSSGNRRAAQLLAGADTVSCANVWH